MFRTPLSLLLIVILALCAPLANAQKPQSLSKDNVSSSMRFDGPSNDFVEIYLLESGQFSIGTTGGDPSNVNDDYQDLIFGHPDNNVGSDGGPGTSFTTFSIDGNYYFNSDESMVSSGPTIVGDYVETSWVYDGVTIVQTLSIVSGTTTGNPDAVKIVYRLTNGKATAADIGLRLLLDTMLGDHDDAPFWIPGVGGVTEEREFLSGTIPQFYQVFDDLSNPTVQAEGTLLGADATPPDRFVIGNWSGMYFTEWDYSVPSTSSIWDSALSIWWNPVNVPAGSSLTLVTFYGLAGVSLSSGDMSLGVTSPTTLERSQSGELYPNPFDITAFVQNGTTSTVSNVQAMIELPTGLHLASGTLEQSLGDMAEGAQQQVSWRVEADESIYGTLSFAVELMGTGVATQRVERNVQVAFPESGQTDGEWTEQGVTLYDSPEADIMVRTGDIDNLGFGWPSGFDPFDGNSTPAHGFPWVVDPTDAAGTDRVMVVSSYSGSPPSGQDGYTSSTSRPANIPEAVTLNWDLNGRSITAATLQIFVDDFQAPVWRANYQVYLDGLRATFMEPVINSLQQTGPIGKLVTFDVPPTYLHLLMDGQLDVFIDDPVTGAGDGFAIDFVKLLINPGSTVRRGALTGVVRDGSSSSPLSNVQILVNGLAAATTASDGSFSISDITAGLASIQTRLEGYGATTTFVDIIADSEASVSIYLNSPAPIVSSYAPTQGQVDVATGSTVSMSFDQAMNTTTLGSGSFTLSTVSQTVSGTFDVTDTSLVFTPDSPLLEGTTYTASLSEDAHNTAGVSLWRPFEWSFTTGGTSTCSTLDQNDTPACATLVNALPFEQEFELEPEFTDVDWYRIELVVGVEYTFETTGSADPKFYLYGVGVADGSNTGAQVGFDDDGGEFLNAKLVYTPSASGYHFLRVADFSNDPGKLGAAYTLRITAANSTDAEDGSELPNTVVLYAAYPNPFNPVTTLTVEMPDVGEVELDVFSATGQRVASLFEGVLLPGQHTFRWVAQGRPSGVYLARLRVGGEMRVTRMVLLK